MLADSMTLSAGSKLGPYEILAPLGAGGVGEVYRAKDPRLGRDVAIKVLPVSFSADADRLRRFEQEAVSRAAVRARRDRVRGPSATRGRALRAVIFIALPSRCMCGVTAIRCASKGRNGIEAVTS